MPPPDPLGLVGKTIADKYAIESVVGEGGFAIVYKAQHLLWKRPVAVKVFKALGDVREADRGKLLDEFVREGALLAELSERSAAIVPGARRRDARRRRRASELPYMVLEWLEGATLERVLATSARRGAAAAHGRRGDPPARAGRRGARARAQQRDRAPRREAGERLRPRRPARATPRR